MLKREMTRRNMIKSVAPLVALLSFGRFGRSADSVPETKPTSKEPRDALVPPPKLGWETFASGAAGPGPRSRHAIGYDLEAKVVVLFGGIVWSTKSLQSDTWELHGRVWEQIRTAQTPPARHRAAMTYLVDKKQLLMFGGQSKRGAMLNDTWSYSNRQWQPITGRGSVPSPRCGHCLAFDESSQKIVLFGGITPDDKPLGDTWLFDGESWTEAAVPGPSARRYAALAYDPDLKGCVLHGGCEDDNGKRTFGDTWQFRDGKWSSLGKESDTEPRDDHSLAYHRTAKRLVMLGGLSGGSGLLLRGPKGWEKVQPNPALPRHQCSPLVWDQQIGALLLHGGEARHGGPQLDTTHLLYMPAA